MTIEEAMFQIELKSPYAATRVIWDELHRLHIVETTSKAYVEAAEKMKTDEATTHYKALKAAL